MFSLRSKEMVNTLTNYLTTKNTFINLMEIIFQKEKLTSYPQVVDIVVTKRCNLDCCFCKKYQSSSDNLTISQFNEIATKVLPTARKLNICSGGEPFANKELINMLRIAKKHNVWTSVSTNGMLLNEKIINIIINENLIDSLNFSVDGINKRTVEQIRIGSNLNRIFDNIQKFVEIKNEKKLNKPIMSIRYALMLKNIKELPDAVSYWGNIGINRIACNYLSLCNGIEKEQSLYFHNELTEKVFIEAKSRANEYEDLSLILPPIRNNNGYNNVKPKRCIHPWGFIMIDVDGRVFPGYNSWGAITMGNILSNKKHFRSIWNNKLYRQLRQTVNNDNSEKIFPYCSICPSKLGNGSDSLHFGDNYFLKELDSEGGKKIQSEVNRLPDHQLCI